MTDDLISRQAAIATAISGRVRTLPTTEDGEDWIRVNEVRESLLNLPPAEPRWIPVTERVPEECVEVNITWVNNAPESYYADLKGKPLTGSGVYCKGRWYWYSAVCVDYCKEYGVSACDEMDEAIEVTAWMPLPKPWEGEDDETSD